jgi:hypothetical protein
MINSVRNTVLAILNKNNYGYISPSDFNLFSKQAQLDIFDEYFVDYNSQINKENARVSGTEYADIKKGLEEVIDYFSITSTLTQNSGNVYFLPSPTTTGYDYYLINKVLCYSSGVFKGEAEKVSHSKITMLNNSLLTKPSEIYPAYTQQASLITIYPTTFNAVGNVISQYIRYPKDPKWTYITVSSGEPIFDQTQVDYQDFELPIDDETRLVNRILQYAGMSIREIQAIQFAIGEEQQENQS